VNETKPGFLAQIRSFPRTFWIANTMEIFERMAWYGFFAVAALYMTGPIETGALGFTMEEKGLILAIVPFFLYIFPVLTGALADRYGYKRMFIIAYLGMVAFYYMLGQFETFWGFLGAFMCVAVSAAIFKPVVVGTVARVTDATNSSTGFGVFYMMVNVGGFVGPIVAGVIRGVSWDYVFLVCSGWAAVNLLIVIFFYKEPTTEADSDQKRSLRQVLDNSVEVLGNLRFFITVFVVLMALLFAGFGYPWFTFKTCLWFCPLWVVLNLAVDRMLPKDSGKPISMGGTRRNPLVRRMFCSNWRFAVFLLIMSGFWTSFNQIFLTMPEYIRDSVETRPMVDAGRKVFNAIGKPEWISGLAAIEENELLGEFDRIVRQGRGVEPMVVSEESEEDEVVAEMTASEVEAAEAEAAEVAEEEQRLWEIFVERNLTAAELERLELLVPTLNSPEASSPLTADDLIASARSIVQYKVRLTPEELGGLVAAIPAEVSDALPEQLDEAVASINGQLTTAGSPRFEGEGVEPLRTILGSLVTTHGPLVPRAALESAAAQLPVGSETLEPKILALGVRDIVYRPHIWERVDAGRQVNPEHIVNFDAGAIILLQVLISFIMARYHRFTTMIVGMIVAAVGISLPAFAGGTVVGLVGASLGFVVAGIVVFAIGEMMASPTSQEYVGRIAPRDKVALYMGYYFVAMALGNLFGGILSGPFQGYMARDLQRPDLMWLTFGGLMLVTAFVFLLYNRFALPKEAADSLTPDSQ
jgi:MFS family permease